MIILEDYTALSNLSINRNVYKVQIDNGIFCYKTKSIQETQLLIRIGKNKHIPKLIDYDIKKGWLIKEWCHGEVINDMDRLFWSLDRIRELYNFTKNIFELFHPLNLLLQDFKPKNISYGDKFMYFDLDWVVSDSHVFSNTLGSKKYLYKSFESLYNYPISSTNDDYFSFANIIYNALVGIPKWSNSKKDPMEAYEQFENEYEEFKDEFLDSLNSIGLKPCEVNFIIDCFNPIRQNRPQVFNWDNYSSCS